MAKLVSRKTTTTVIEEVEIVPAATGEDQGHRYLTVGGYGDYLGENGCRVAKPQINLNARWLAEAGFMVGEKIDVCVKENELVIRKLVTSSENL